MKRFLCFLIALLPVCCAGCGLEDPVILSLPEYGSKEVYSYGEFQDYTDFGIFHFDFPITESVSKNPYFSQVGQDRDGLVPYIENFEKWVEVISEYEDPKFSEYYTFDRAMLDPGDWYFLDSKYGNTNNYDLYLYDTQTNILYFFHNNI